MSSEKRLGNLRQDAIFSTTWVCRRVWWFNGVSASSSGHYCFTQCGGGHPGLVGPDDGTLVRW